MIHFELEYFWLIILLLDFKNTNLVILQEGRGGGTNLEQEILIRRSEFLDKCKPHRSEFELDTNVSICEYCKPKSFIIRLEKK